uniref:Uncharacterized protein n=1 Tax=Anopheles christyi TaxID=43041 RepID=A0A182KJ15_9DIPT
MNSSGYSFDTFFCNHRPVFLFFFLPFLTGCSCRYDWLSVFRTIRFVGCSSMWLTPAKADPASKPLSRWLLLLLLRLFLFCCHRSLGGSFLSPLPQCRSIGFGQYLPNNGLPTTDLAIHGFALCEPVAGGEKH